MRDKFQFFIPIAIAVGALTGCGDPALPLQPAQRSQSETSSDPGESLAPLTFHVVAPQATDPAIDRALDDHYVWLDPSVRSKHRLFVFLPGTNQHPATFKLVPQEAARLGYHAIGLMYQDDVGVNAACRAVADPGSCLENTRLELLDGIHRSPVVTVTPPNGIDNRLTKLLQYLDRTYPEEE